MKNIFDFQSEKVKITKLYDGLGYIGSEILVVRKKQDNFVIYKNKDENAVSLLNTGVLKLISLPYFDNLAHQFQFRYLNFLSDLKPYVLKAAQPFSY